MPVALLLRNVAVAVLLMLLPKRLLLLLLQQNSNTHPNDALDHLTRIVIVTGILHPMLAASDARPKKERPGLHKRSYKLTITIQLGS